MSLTIQCLTQLIVEEQLFIGCSAEPPMPNVQRDDREGNVSWQHKDGSAGRPMYRCNKCVESAYFRDFCSIQEEYAP